MTAYRLPRWLSGKASTCQARDMGLIPGLGRLPGEGNGNPLQYSRLGNPMDRRAWRATDHRVTKQLDMTVTYQEQQVFTENLNCMRRLTFSRQQT